MSGDDKKYGLLPNGNSPYFYILLKCRNRIVKTPNGFRPIVFAIRHDLAQGRLRCTLAICGVNRGILRQFLTVCAVAILDDGAVSRKAAVSAVRIGPWAVTFPIAKQPEMVPLLWYPTTPPA